MSGARVARWALVLIVAAVGIGGGIWRGGQVPVDRRPCYLVEDGSRVCWRPPSDADPYVCWPTREGYTECRFGVQRESLSR